MREGEKRDCERRNRLIVLTAYLRQHFNFNHITSAVSKPWSTLSQRFFKEEISSCDSYTEEGEIRKKTELLILSLVQIF